MSRVIVIGGHGKVALLAAPLLVAAGHEVRSVIRNLHHGDDVRSSGAEPLIADVEHLTIEGLAEVMAGCDIVVWSAGAGGGNPDRTYAVDRDAAIRSMDAADLAGIDRYVMVSYFGAGPDHGVPQDNPFFHYASAKAVADAHLMATELEWTILQPSALTHDEPTGLIESGPGVVAGHTSRGNVARVIAAVIAHPETTSRRVIAFNDGDRTIADVVAAP